MFNRRRSFVGLCVTAICLGALVFLPNHFCSQAEPRAVKRGLTPEKLAQEKWLLHQATAAAQPNAPSQAGFQEINDLAVVPNSSQFARQPNPFDLNGRSLLFTPAGRNYTISNLPGAFDNNLGTKLNLTAAPAVNPKADAQPGDDAFWPQELGFNFPFFGNNYSIACIASNGNLTLRNASAVPTYFNISTVFQLGSLEEMRTGPPRVAAYWHDLDTRAVATQDSAGIYLRRESDRLVVTWHNVRDYPNQPGRDRGTHRFQIVLFRDGRISFNYDSVRLTSKALVGLAQGGADLWPVLVNLNTAAASPPNRAFAEFFTIEPGVDELAVVRAFLQARANREVFDFIYVLTDFTIDEVSGPQPVYLPIRNDVRGLGLSVFDNDPSGTLGARRLQGVISINNVTSFYPDLPTTRFFGGFHTLGLLTQQTGRRWLAAVRYTGNDPKILLGREESYWNAFLNTETGFSTAAARRASVMGGNVWEDIGNGSFLSSALSDGYSRLDQYLMGLRPAAQVPASAVLTNVSNAGELAQSFSVRPDVLVSATSQPVTINEIIAANGARVPAADTAPKNFRAAFILVTASSAPPSAALLNKLTRLRLALESYFAQATDFQGTLNTGLAEQTVSRVVAAVSAASFRPVTSPGEIAALFGSEMTNPNAMAAIQPLPTTLNGVQVLVNGTAAPLFLASPGQINFQVPRATVATNTMPGFNSTTALIEVIRNGQLIRAGAVQIAPVAPSLFTLEANGTGTVAAVDAFRGTLAPFALKQANGAPNIIAVFGTGLGSDATDVGGSQANAVQATFDGLPGTVLYAGRAPGFTGLNQFNIQFPANLAAGTRTLIIRRNGIASAPVTVAVR